MQQDETSAPRRPPLLSLAPSDCSTSGASSYNGSSISSRGSISTVATSLGSPALYDSALLSPVFNLSMTTRSFPSYVSGLLAALEADPQSAAKNLRNGYSPSSFQPSMPEESRPIESDAIYASIVRLAERLAKAEAKGSINQPAPLQGALPPTPEISPAIMSESSDADIYHQATPAFAGQTHITSVPMTPASSNEEPYVYPASAEEELGQLKAQIQDFARVCKVCYQ